MNTDLYVELAQHIKGTRTSQVRNEVSADSVSDFDPNSFDGYFDESGNTGTNFLDRTQPMFVIAGWLVQRPGLDKANAVVCETLAGLPGNATELKTNRLLGSPRGQNAMAVLLERLTDAGCLPKFYVAEKYFMVAGKIVETFIDPPVNTRVNEQFTGNTTAKNILANQLCSLPLGMSQTYLTVLFVEQRQTVK